MGKLSNPKKQYPVVTSKVTSPFVLSFKYCLQNNYTFKEMYNKTKLRELQNFLNVVSKMSLQEVELRYTRDSDATDRFNGEQVIHYGVGKNFRIHGIIENGEFVVLRLDPNHNFHS